MHGRDRAREGLGQSATGRGCGCARSCFATLFFVAALPGVGAVFLRVYENTLVRQTEAELVAQGAALAAAARGDLAGRAAGPGRAAAAAPIIAPTRPRST